MSARDRNNIASTKLVKEKTYGRRFISPLEKISKRSELKIHMYNNTGKSWILARDIANWSFGSALDQKRELAIKSREREYEVAGCTIISSPLESPYSYPQIQRIIKLASERKIDALFIVRKKYLSEDVQAVDNFINKLNENGVAVYDIDGNIHDQIWYREQMEIESDDI